jgi:hypothetical protein
MQKPPQQRHAHDGGSQQGVQRAPAQSPLSIQLAGAAPVRALQAKASLLNAGASPDAPIQRKLFIGGKQVTAKAVEANVPWNVDLDRQAALKGFAADGVDSPARRFKSWNQAIYPPEPQMEMPDWVPNYVSQDGFFRLKLVKSPGKLSLVGGGKDLPEDDIEGKIDYQFDKRGMLLKTFEAHPPRLGVGAILLRELAIIALANKADVIDVAMPAWTAMGAYKEFGGKPKDKDLHAKLIEKYMDEERQEKFIQQEGEEAEKAKSQAETFWSRHPGAPGRPKPSAAPPDGKPKIGGEERARATILMAMSHQLIFESAQLLGIAEGKMKGRWIPK